MITVSRRTRIDWPRMAQHLRKAGDSWQSIADELGIDKTALYNWAREDAQGEPAFWTGAAFIELWCKRTSLLWSDLPTRNVVPSVSASLRAMA